MSRRDGDPTTRFMAEVQAFRDWAAAYGPDKEISSCWGCYYQGWYGLHDAAEEFCRRRPFASWSPDEMDAMLYALARDEDGRTLSRLIREASPSLVLDLVEQCCPRGERNARWQLADELGRVGEVGGRRDAALLRLADDEDEYVRRRAMLSLLALRHPDVERLAIESWSRPADAWSQLSARRMTLHVLDDLGSVHLQRFLDEAERDGRPELTAEAAEIRRRLGES
jgi:hypothetical protein